MAEPIVFISRFAIKEGSLDQFKDLARAVSADIQASKPRTLLYLSYLDEARHTVSFLHAFADADSMDRHFEGSGDRSRAVYEFVEPRGWEIYGTPSAEALETLRGAAASAGTPLTVTPECLTGFLRVDGVSIG
jgi:quinol monooxygenase YgiN